MKVISNVPVSRNWYKSVSKELSLWNEIKYLNHNIFRTRCCKPLIFQTQIIWSNRIHSLKYLRYATFGSKEIVIGKSEFVAKTQFLYFIFPLWLLKRQEKDGIRPIKFKILRSNNFCISIKTGTLIKDIFYFYWKG